MTVVLSVAAPAGLGSRVAVTTTVLSLEVSLVEVACACAIDATGAEKASRSALGAHEMTE